MEISRIKQQLTISEVIRHYGLKPDKQNRLHCPFHPDKTPSLQVYYKTQTAYCFSSNCKTHGKSMDVIDFILYKENWDILGAEGKHKAIEKALLMAGGESPAAGRLPAAIEKATFLDNIFQYFRNAVHNSKPAQQYLQSRCLDFKLLETGYNTGQFHHGVRKDETLIKQCLQYGLLLDNGQTAKTGDKAYTVFGKWCICFALKNKDNQIVSLYFRSTLNNENAKHFYLKDRQGLYPGYPGGNTGKLILTESIIDAASLLQAKDIAENYSILALYGTNGLTDEHRQAIKEWASVAEPAKAKEIIFAFDNDPAGKEAVYKYTSMLRAQHPLLRLTSLCLPCKDINETLQAHSPEVFAELLKKRSEPDFFLSPGSTTEKEKEKKEEAETETETKAEVPGDVFRFLKQKNLVTALNHEIGRAGIVGEENSRMLLFLIALSYLNRQPLHGLVQGSSGSGKTHIISRIAEMMPQEDVLRFTRITESSLYNWGEYELFGKIIIIEDLDGLKEDALYALREFISNQVLRSSVTVRDKKGNNKSVKKEVKGQFSSLSATTKGETYEDNMSRSFLVAVDESKEQTRRIIQYQNRRNAGETDPGQPQKAISFIQQVIRQLKYHEVINPYATRLHLPEKVHKIRRLNEMYQAVIKQVTILNQYQRELSPQGCLITRVEDIEQATEILFDSIVLKVDELDGGLRQFFERLKKHVKDPGQEFVLREVRLALNVSKTQMFRYILSLCELEYIRPSGGYTNKGIRYKICYWDNYQKLRSEIKDFLMTQTEQLKKE